MIPQAYLDEMKKLLGEEDYCEYEKTLSQPLRKGLRVNRIKAAPDFMPPFERLKPIPWARDGFYVEGEQRVGSHLLHAAGAYYCQEPSAMCVAQILDPKQGERVLDLCAAPGGKTTQAAALMADSGLLVANEIHPTRARILAENVVRMGLTHTVVTVEHPSRLAEKLKSYFDAVIVDAPCSGEGMFKKSDDAVQDWSRENVSSCADRQAKILDSAAECLRTGGRLVYSTCTFSLAENEANIAAFLARHDDFRLLPIEAPMLSDGFAVQNTDVWSRASVADGRKSADVDTTLCKRIFPHRACGEGHFVALMTKTGESQTRCTVRPSSPHADAAVQKLYAAFCRDNGVKPTALSLEQWGDRLFGVGLLPDLKGIKTVVPGLNMGRVKNGRFEPSQAYASSLLKHEARFVELDYNGAAAYLRGEQLEGVTNEKGWLVAAVDGFSLGWIKCSDGVAKNHYDKSLRRI